MADQKPEPWSPIQGWSNPMEGAGSGVDFLSGMPREQEQGREEASRVAAADHRRIVEMQFLQSLGGKDGEVFRVLLREIFNGINWLVESPPHAEEVPERIAKIQAHLCVLEDVLGPNNLNENFAKHVVLDFVVDFLKVDLDMSKPISVGIDFRSNGLPAQVTSQK